MKASLGPSLSVDVDRLLVSRLLVQANSGGGKSWALRRLLEQTFGACQHLVLDPEGEFHTLRESFDYVLVGKGGEAKASVDTAELLALRLLELGTSAIIDISELGVDRPAFVTKFLEALMGAPRELWHSVLVVVDEAHRYCPQGVRPRQPSQRDDDEPLTAEDSAAAVISLMDSGRKRGFCGVLATQRISKLSKDASAECNNKLIGRCVELDAKRAGDELGLTSKNAIGQLRKLRAGQFFAFGPALCDDVTLTTIGEVQTTHPEAGKAAPPPTPPRDRIRQVLGKLADLPKEAADEKAGTETMRARIRELEMQLAARPAPPVETRIVEKEVLSIAALARLQDALVDATNLRDRTSILAGEFGDAVQTLDKALSDMNTTVELLVQSNLRGLATFGKEGSSNGAAGPVRSAATSHAERRSRAVAAGETASTSRVKQWPGPPPSGSSLVPAQQRIVDTIATLKKLGMTPERKLVAAWIGQHPNTKGFVNNVGALRSAGLVDDFDLTADGMRIARANVPRTRDEIYEMLVRPLTPAQRRIVEAVRKLGRADREELAELLDKHPNTKGLVNDIGALRGRALVTEGWPLQLERVFQVGAP